MALTFHQRRRLREGRKWLGPTTPSVFDRFASELFAMAAGSIFTLVLVLVAWGMVS